MSDGATTDRLRNAAGPGSAAEILRQLRASAPGRPAAAPAPAPLNRRRHADPALRLREADWWQRFAVLEDRYFWVLHDAFQPPARRRYLERLATGFAGCATVVDYGCGSGWFAAALAAHGVPEVLGLDFSPAQIALARAQHPQTPHLRFDTIAGPAELPAADGYVFHGLLHHLPAAEIDELLENLASRAPRGARIAIVEPTCFPGHAPDPRDRAVLDLVDALVDAPRRALAERGLAEAPAIARIRDEADTRWWGELPYGPSPMERPFERDELARHLAGRFDVERTELVQFLPASQALAGELAMLAESSAALAHELAGVLQPQMDLLERALLAFPEPPDRGWYMTLVTATVR